MNKKIIFVILIIIFFKALVCSENKYQLIHKFNYNDKLILFNYYINDKNFVIKLCNNNQKAKEYYLYNNRKLVKIDLKKFEKLKLKEIYYTS